MEHKPTPTRSCISCGKILLAEDFGDYPEGQVDMSSPCYDGVYIRFTTGGNYGSTVFDMEEYGAEGFVCDECFVQKSDRLYAFTHGEDKNCGKKIADLSGDFFNKKDIHGPAYLAKYTNGESWIRGVRYYEPLTSRDRSAIEAQLLGSQGEDHITISRGLVEGLLAALRASEHNILDKDSENRRFWSENESMKQCLAGSPNEAEVGALLHKEAEEIKVTDLKELKEYTRWALKIQDWLHDNPMFHEDGTALDTMRLWVELTAGEEGLKALEERNAMFSEYVKLHIEAEKSGEDSDEK